MIRLTRLDGKEFVLNADLIETLEAVPDTVVSLTTGRKLVVREPVEEIIQRVVAYRRRLAVQAAVEKLLESDTGSPPYGAAIHGGGLAVTR